MRNDRAVESFANMSQNRQNKKAFLWASEVHAVLNEVELQYKLCSKNLSCSMNTIKRKFLSRFTKKCIDTLKPKLQTYIQIKSNYGLKADVMANPIRRQRALLAQLKTGIFPLVLDVCRYKKHPG